MGGNQLRSKLKTFLGVTATALVSIYLALIIASFFSAAYVELKTPPNVPVPKGGIARVGSGGSNEPFSFIVLGDIRRGMSWFRVLMDKAERRKPAFVMLLGDFANEAKLSEYRFFFKTMEKTGMTIPLVIAPGNHDVSLDGVGIVKDIYKRFFGDLYYYFSYSDSLFVVLDGATSWMDEEQMVWLEKVLREVAPEYRRVFMFTHVPPIPLESTDCRCMVKEYRERLMKLMDKYPVDIFFSSHLHNYYRTTRNGTLFLVTGGGGSRLQPFLEGDGFHHMVEVKVSPDRVQDNIISVRRVREWPEWIDYFLVVEFYPLIERYPVLFVIQLAAGGLFIVLVVRALRRKKRANRRS